MVDLEPFLEAPFEEASNLTFEALLGLGAALLAAVAVLGRSRVTMAAVAVYLLLIPGYVGYRIRAWDGDDESDADEPDADADGCRDDVDGGVGTDGEVDDGETDAVGDDGAGDTADGDGGDSASDVDSTGDEDG